jgi:hypothetical protein
MGRSAYSARAVIGSSATSIVIGASNVTITQR